ncbi:DUF3298 and DUF4163 domain-containing protein [Gracilibacillus caseinilyticus]|uniref:DUF3298 and DUF4163 domain-containing protein n=1 Tax=Gracilibacillus caseinilyticus TaxID=2932256 RepID=A0ABY4ESM2_9BACI|nr:DUF3298 and DUF4163 domain-containing protein [Gracilibacillus caseinilyticus]UOQ46955.1 DUF3298 and DUF4163 domain-containing protein [Gracilibacillus caseinilyticus]
MSELKKGLVILTICLMMPLISLSVLAANQTATVSDELYEEMAALKYPKVSEVANVKMEHKINKIFQNYITASYNELKENEEEAAQHDFPGEYQTDYEVKYNQSPLLSILTSNYMFSGGAHGNTVVESFNFDVSKEKRVFLTDILTKEEQVKAVRDFVWEYAIERPDIFYPDLEKGDIKLSNETAFYFTDDGITLVFQQYEIAPYVSGNQEIAIPKKVYEKVLK